MPITSFIVEELEALLEALIYCLRQGDTLYVGLVECGTYSLFDAETLGELEYLHYSRFELLHIAGAIVQCLSQFESPQIKEVA